MPKAAGPWPSLRDLSKGQGAVSMFLILIIPESYFPNPMGCPDGSDGKESACNAGDPGSIPESGRSPGERHSSILAWGIPWTEEPGRLQSMGLQRVRHFP